MKNPHKSQSAAMDRAGELPDGEQLRECINSGQVSAAQVVAHQEAGELSAIGRVTEAALRQIADIGKALAAERAEVARLREALTQGEALINGDLTGLEWKVECRKFLVAARAALGLYQGATNEHK